MENKIDQIDSNKKKECDNYWEFEKLKVDFKYEFFGDSHSFELERRHSLTNHAYWLIGILIGLIGAFGYLWINRLTNVLFFLLMSCTGGLCLLALVLAIIAAWPRKYYAIDGSNHWNNYWDTLSEYNKDYDDWETRTLYGIKRELANQFVNMEIKNRKINDSREQVWMKANKIVIVVIVMLLIGIASIHFADFNNEVQKVFVREVKIYECAENGKKSSFNTETTTTATSSEEH